MLFNQWIKERVDLVNAKPVNRRDAKYGDDCQIMLFNNFSRLLRHYSWPCFSEHICRVDCLQVSDLNKLHHENFHQDIFKI